jgi:hypothetical protein
MICISGWHVISQIFPFTTSLEVKYKDINNKPFFLILNFSTHHCRCRRLLLLLIILSDTHTHRQTDRQTRYDSSGRGIGLPQTPLPDSTQYSQDTGIHVLGGIRTRNPSKWVAAYRRLRPRIHWDRTERCVSLVRLSLTGPVVVQDKPNES